MSVANGKKGKKRLIFILSSVSVIVLIMIGAVAATRGGSRIDPSKLAKVERGDLAKNVVATGKIQAITQVDVKSKASGIVKKLLVDYGQPVKQGQVLVELDKEEIQARVNQQRASLEAAEAAAHAAEADLCSRDPPLRHRHHPVPPLQERRPPMISSVTTTEPAVGG